MENIFKEGDEVFHIQYGWGVVEEIKLKATYGISVRFKEELIIFTLDGRYHEEDTIPTLSFAEYKLDGFTQKRPIDLPEVGELILVRDDEESSWISREYYGIQHNQKHGDRFLTKNIGNEGLSSWAYMRRFKFL